MQWCIFCSCSGKHGGGWSRNGCTKAPSNVTHTVCKCHHLTSFAVVSDLKIEVSFIAYSFSCHCQQIAINGEQFRNDRGVLLLTFNKIHSQKYAQVAASLLTSCNSLDQPANNEMRFARMACELTAIQETFMFIA